MSHNISNVDMPVGERFFQGLRDLHDMELLRQLDDTMTELCSAVMETGGKGCMVLKLAVAKKGKDRQIAVKPTVTRTIPQEETRERLLYADETGRFCLDDPAQRLLDFDAPVRVENPERKVAADAPVRIVK